MSDTADINRQRKRAGRWAGFFYLAYIATFIFASYVQEKPVVWDDADATPEFNVIGYAAGRAQAVEIAHRFADSCGRLFIELGGTR